jgi:hypothetical protein
MTKLAKITIKIRKNQIFLSPMFNHSRFENCVHVSFIPQNVETEPSTTR